jgi:hypothetical protein
MAMKITAFHKSNVSVMLNHTTDYKSVAHAKKMVKYYRENGKDQMANEINQAIKLQQKAIKDLDKVLSGEMTWEELNNQ